MKTTHLLALPLVLCSMSSLDAQWKDFVDLTLSSALTPALKVAEAYQPADFETELRSNPSPGFEVQLNFTRMLSEKAALKTGAALGMHAYQLSFSVEESFRTLGGNGFSDRYSEFVIPYAAVSLGGSYAFFQTRRSAAELYLGGRLAYPFRASSQLSIFAIPEHGQTTPLLQADMINNDDNILVLAAEVRTQYRYTLKNDRHGFLLGIHWMYSGRSPFAGNYQVFGDARTLEGTLAKRFGMTGFSAGYFFNP